MNLVNLALEYGAAQAGLSKTSHKGFDTALCIVVPLSRKVVMEIDKAPTYEYFHHYRTVNALIDEIILKIGLNLLKNGYDYFPIAASQTIGGAKTFKGSFSHKIAAVNAGLGCIGKNSLFISNKFGPFVRLGTIFTDYKYDGENKISESKCAGCDKCVKACPAGCISGEEFDINNPTKDLIDRRLCSDYMKQNFQLIGRGSVCGICMRVCSKKG